uniref:Uncharacterized protein n=1 Tax=Caenorhabditis japonica TaxID=281687 RepID=A0A8R1EPN0_CAEJA
MASNLLENELEDILNQMGQHVETQAQLHMLKGEIERYLAEEPYMSSDDDELTNQDVLNGSLFASLSIDPAAQFLRRQQVAQEAIQSPIISRTPGDMRRLSLRWKVREYMLRHDVPRLTAINPEGKAEHPKDWSPRPYMD